MLLGFGCPAAIGNKAPRSPNEYPVTLVNFAPLAGLPINDLGIVNLTLPFTVLVIWPVTESEFTRSGSYVMYFLEVAELIEPKLPVRKRAWPPRTSAPTQ